MSESESESELDTLESAIKFFNLDVELESNESLQIIADDLGDFISVMFIGEHNNTHAFSFELSPLIQVVHTPEQYTKCMVKLLTNLSKDAAAALAECTKIDFNYGFGGTSGTLEVNLLSSSIVSLAKLNASITTIIYPYS